MQFQQLLDKTILKKIGMANFRISYTWFSSLEEKKLCVNNYFEGQFAIFQFTKLFQHVRQINEFQDFPQTQIYKIAKKFKSA